MDSVITRRFRKGGDQSAVGARRLFKSSGLQEPIGAPAHTFQRITSHIIHVHAQSPQALARVPALSRRRQLKMNAFVKGDRLLRLTESLIPLRLQQESRHVSRLRQRSHACNGRTGLTAIER